MADYTETEEASRRMTTAALALSRMAPEVALARQVKEYDGERRKRALAVLVVEQLNSGKMSVGEAEARARACDGFGAALNDLGEQYRSAMRTLEDHAATVVNYESARSLLSMEREKMKL